VAVPRHYRTWQAITLTATGMGLRRQGRKREVIEDHSLTMYDFQLLKGKGLTLSGLSICNLNLEHLNVWS
jgi:hypothetical protein